MPPRDRNPGAGAARRVWIPLLAAAVIAVPAILRLRSLPDAPAATSAASASGSTSEPPAPAEPPRPARLHLGDRSISRTGAACQEWKLGSPPRRVRCPDSLDDGEVLRFDPDATCRRLGARDAVVPCPMESELSMPASAAPAPAAPPTPDRPDGGRHLPAAPAHP